MHVTLHLADAKVILDPGSDEKRPLARGGLFENFVPKGFVMVYAPTSEEDLEVLVRTAEAGAWFLGGKGAEEEGCGACMRSE